MRPKKESKRNFGKQTQRWQAVAFLPCLASFFPIPLFPFSLWYTQSPMIRRSREQRDRDFRALTSRDPHGQARGNGTVGGEGVLPRLDCR